MTSQPIINSQWKLWTKSINHSIDTSEKPLSGRLTILWCSWIFLFFSSFYNFFNHISFSVFAPATSRRFNDLVAGFLFAGDFSCFSCHNFPNKYTQHLMSTPEQLFIMTLGEERETSGVKKSEGEKIVGAVVFSCRFSRWWRFHLLSKTSFLFNSLSARHFFHPKLIALF